MNIMKKLHTNIKIFAIIFTLILISLITLVSRSEIFKNFNIQVLANNEEVLSLFEYDVADIKENNIYIVINIDSNEILKNIKCPNGNEVSINNKQKICIDYNVEKGVEYIFQMIQNDGTIIEKKLCLDYTVYTFGDANETYDGISGKMEQFTAPENGDYLLEVWGAKGGYNGENVGNGGYSRGYTKLSKNDKLYVYLGGRGLDIQYVGHSYLPGGFNGGGNSGIASWYTPYSAYCACYGSGGGATDIRTVKASNGSWYDTEHEDWSTDKSLLSRIIVAGGGGARGGEAGGGLVTSTASQTSGYKFGLGQNGHDGINAGSSAEGNGGAGGGWYGGTTPNTAYNSSGTGGSGYIGSLSFAKSISGSLEVPTYDGTSTMIGNASGGYAKITCIYSK